MYKRNVLISIAMDKRRFQWLEHYSNSPREMLLTPGSAEGAGGETASGAHRPRPMCDAHPNEAAAEFDLKHAGKSRKKQQSCTRITHFIGNHDIRE